MFGMCVQFLRGDSLQQWLQLDFIGLIFVTLFRSESILNHIIYSTPQPARMPLSDKSSMINDGASTSAVTTSQLNENPNRPVGTPNPRKRVAKPDTWKGNKAKKAREEGRSYVSPYSGKDVEAR